MTARAGLLALAAVLAMAALLVRLVADAASGTGDSNLVLAGKVTRVIDGDSVQVALDSGLVEVRLHGVDAPEKKQPFGREAWQALQTLIGGRQVELLPVAQDRYERQVAVVLLDGASAGEELLAQGHAWAYRQYLGQLPGDERYCALEARARAARSGLWSQPAVRWVPPWIYRQRSRAAPGTLLPAGDYSAETEADCQAAIGVRAALTGSAAEAPPVPAGTPDPACLIKGNINRKGARIYHLPGSSDYAQTRIDGSAGERWFCSEAEAQAAGWRAPR